MKLPRKWLSEYVDMTGISDAEFVEKMDGHAVIVVDTETVPVSDVIAFLSKQTDVLDISVSGSSAEEMVVTLYKEFSI